MVKSRRDLRAELVEAGARVLAEEGPRALSARSLARAAGTSTMAVYTHFGGMPTVVRAIIQEGFARLAAELATVPPTEDPVTDCVALGLAYRRAAHREPHLYKVMFGATGFDLTPEDRAVGLYTLRFARDLIPRCIKAGRFRPADPWMLTRQSWCLVHGLVSLELAGFYADFGLADADLRVCPGLSNVDTGMDGVEADPSTGHADRGGASADLRSVDAEFLRYLQNFAVGAGDDPQRAAESAARAFLPPEG